MDRIEDFDAVAREWDAVVALRLDDASDMVEAYALKLSHVESMVRIEINNLGDDVNVYLVRASDWLEALERMEAHA